MRVQLHLPPLRSLDLLISPGTLPSVCLYLFLIYASPTSEDIKPHIIIIIVCLSASLSPFLFLSLSLHCFPYWCSFNLLFVYYEHLDCSTVTTADMSVSLNDNIFIDEKRRSVISQKTTEPISQSSLSLCLCLAVCLPVCLSACLSVSLLHGSAPFHQFEVGYSTHLCSEAEIFWSKFLKP